MGISERPDEEGCEQALKAQDFSVGQKTILACKSLPKRIDASVSIFGYHFRIFVGLIEVGSDISQVSEVLAALVNFQFV